MASDERGVTFIWEIGNFDLLLKTEEYQNLCTPLFKVESTVGSAWGNLCAFHRNSFIQFELMLKGSFNAYRCEMSLISSCGVLPLKRNHQWGYSVEKKTSFDEKEHSILPNDTLTLHCRIWGEKIRPLEFHIPSVLHSLNYLWNITDFDSSIFYYDTIIRSDNYTFEVCLERKDEKSAWTVTVTGIPCVQGYLSFANYKLSIKDGRGRIIDETCLCPYINWLCEIEIFPNNTSITLELKSIVVLHKGCREQPIVHSPTEIDKPKNVSEAVSSALGNDLLLLYKENTLSDATLNTEGKSFSAHRSILAARSPVFRAMFERDEMKEGRSGNVDIDDVDSETVDRMLVFLYGDFLGDLQWKEATRLYYAADKYDVLPLKEKCAATLKVCLTADNACDVLVLADKHSDQDLRKCVVNFILDHEEVVSSPQWDELEKGNCMLAAKIIRQLFLKKMKK